MDAKKKLIADQKNCALPAKKSRQRYLAKNV